MATITTHEFDNAQAEREGWSVFRVDRSPGHRFEIERIDDPSDLKDQGLVDHVDPIFDGDDAAMAFVVRQASDGSAYHAQALTFLRENSPIEFLSMSKEHDLGFLTTVEPTARF